MSKDILSKYELQKKVKPSISEMIDNCLQGRLEDDANKFVDFLLENKLSPQWASTNSYSISYKNRRVCIIKFQEDEWEIWLNTQYDADFNNYFSKEQDEMKNILLERLVHCFACGKCAPGQKIVILNKRVEDACFCPVIRFENPNELQLDLARKLVILRKMAIAKGQVPKVMYVAMSKRDKL